MARQQPTDAELKLDSHHVLYEIEQLDGAVKRLAGLRASGQQAPEVDENALLESIAVHARALIEFVWADPELARPDDVVASDFVPEWPAIRPEMSEFLRGVKRQADKQIMHITRERSIAEAVRQWRYGKVYNELAEVLAQFVTRVPAEKVQSDFRRRAAAAIPSVRTLERRNPNFALIDHARVPDIYGATQAAPDLDVRLSAQLRQPLSLRAKIPARQRDTPPSPPAYWLLSQLR